jgi:hypothetical protein
LPSKQAFAGMGMQHIECLGGSNCCSGVVALLATFWQVLSAGMRSSMLMPFFKGTSGMALATHVMIHKFRGMSPCPVEGLLDAAGHPLQTSRTLASQEQAIIKRLCKKPVGRSHHMA